MARIALLSSALSRVACPPRADLRTSLIASPTGASPAWLAVMRRSPASDSAPHKVCLVVRSPPRERPRAWSPFFGGRPPHVGGRVPPWHRARRSGDHSAAACQRSSPPLLPTQGINNDENALIHHATLSARARPGGCSAHPETPHIADLPATRLGAKPADGQDWYRREKLILAHASCLLECFVGPW